MQSGNTGLIFGNSIHNQLILLHQGAGIRFRGCQISDISWLSVVIAQARLLVVDQLLVLEDCTSRLICEKYMPLDCTLIASCCCRA